MNNKYDNVKMIKNSWIVAFLVLIDRSFELFYLSIKIQVYDIHGYQTVLMPSYK